MPRVLLKISGEMLCSSGQPIESSMLRFLFDEISQIQKKGIEVAIVVGGGNFWRGRTKGESGISRRYSDRIGMLATIMNALGVSDFFEENGLRSMVFSAVPILGICEGYSYEKANSVLKEGVIAFLSGGTGNPFFTTDSAAAVRAIDLDCDRLLKATTVDGIYNEDPKENISAKKYETLSFDETIRQQIEVMDMAAFSLCHKFSLPICVFDGRISGNMLLAAMGKNVGTIVS
jgi:uridylate kinase